MNRIFLTKLHLILAGLMLPAIVMFLATGALYTWGNTGEWHEQKVQLELAAPLEADTGALKQIALAELDARGIPAPSGSARVRGEGSEMELQWSGARSEVQLAATPDPLTAELTLKQASLHRWLVQLHKAKGSTVFKIYATILAAVLFLLVASGLILGLQVRALRRLTIASSLAGTALFAALVSLG